MYSLAKIAFQKRTFSVICFQIAQEKRDHFDWHVPQAKLYGSFMPKSCGMFFASLSLLLPPVLSPQGEHASQEQNKGNASGISKNWVRSIMIVVGNCMMTKLSGHPWRSIAFQSLGIIVLVNSSLHSTRTKAIGLGKILLHVFGSLIHDLPLNWSISPLKKIISQDVSKICPTWRCKKS